MTKQFVKETFMPCQYKKTILIKYQNILWMYTKYNVTLTAEWAYKVAQEAM